ncbi:MAG: hypothetical protein ABSA97_07660 [Verrucomicrobiia bacterium]
MEDKIIQALEKRVGRLEKAVFGVGKKLKPEKKAGNFKGATGGVRLLISKGFSKKARTAPDVKTELEKNEYVYRIQVVQTSLNRLSKRSGPLSALKEGAKKVYVDRK